ncbi:MAG: sigma-70 family RNA polymerase sigma factor [Saprospiraceae bacterium]|nr:sigma-70 family RNA polymerase sigma factor [Saprospiraceae bacterium]
MEQIVESNISIGSRLFDDEEIVKIYEIVFPSIATLINRLGGSLEDAKDLFHDALIIFYERQDEECAKMIWSREAYIIGIVKKLWIRKFNKNRVNCSLDEAEHKIEIPDDFSPSVNDRRLLRFLEKAGKRCLVLLHTFYYSMIPVKEIAERLGYANEHSVSVQKYKCLDKLKKIVNQKSIEYEDFME